MVERVDGAPCSFLRLVTGKGLVWVAVPMAEVPKRSKVTVKNGAVLKSFESKQAGRRCAAERDATQIDLEDLLTGQARPR